MSTEQLIEMARHNLAHSRAGTIDQTDKVLQVPARHYYDQDRWRLEIDRVFKRVPLMLAMTSELPKPGDYKAMEAVGFPILLSRSDEGQVHAFVNMCSHRGSQVMLNGKGNTNRFTCPYHAWSYDQQGDLVNIYAPKDFGDVDKSCHGLTKLPVIERAGLIWVTLNPQSTLDMNNFLCGYDAMLSHFGFENWHFFESRTIKGPNWKIAYDGYLDLYHLPILHKNTFGSTMPNQALYNSWGPHQRASSPDPSLAKLENDDPQTWPVDTLMNGVWTIFPHVSIASFYGGGRSVMISQLFPGPTPGESYTVQNYLMADEPDESQKEQAREQFKLLEYVVQEEDYATGLRQQQALRTGAKQHVMFGRNEGGGQRFHSWLNQIIAADDRELNELFVLNLS
ncbi:MAG: aromatic ring-hydroxylating dioxygenase subunit alpha [Proteobacteria bacterium]|nr:aromatic ring-hydroxylating dioxygenase subunit alpha [Pseudomonadota bacterium]